jgi:hypothetical protein
MSEFSESFHLRSNKQQDGVNLLKRAGLSGVVFTPTNNWVTVVPEAGLLEAVEPMVRANRGTLLHYMCAEDHGWQFGIYKDTRPVCRYECGWDDELTIEDGDLDLEVIVELLKNRSQRAELEALLQPEDIDALLEGEPPAYQFANLLGLQHYEWLSGQYLDEGVDDRDPNAVTVET